MAKITISTEMPSLERLDLVVQALRPKEGSSQAMRDMLH